MDAMPPQDMRDTTSASGIWLSALAVACVLLGWLLLAWLTGGFPFRAEPVAPQASPQSVIDSLSATGTPVVAPSAGTINSLTAPSTGTTTTTKTTTTTTNTVTNSVLDSLTPKK